MSDQSKPKPTLDLRKERRDEVAAELVQQEIRANVLRDELKKLSKAIKQWEPK